MEWCEINDLAVSGYKDKCLLFKISSLTTIDGVTSIHVKDKNSHDIPYISGTPANMHLATLHFFNILILLPLVMARAISPQALNNKESTHKHHPRYNYGPVPMGKIYCGSEPDTPSSPAVNATQRAYDVISAMSLLGISCQYGALAVPGVGLNHSSKFDVHTTSDFRDDIEHRHLSLGPLSKSAVVFGSVRAYVCNYSQEGSPLTCDITELQAAKQMIEAGCGSKFNAVGVPGPEPEGGPDPRRNSVVGGVWKSWDEMKEYGFMDVADQRDWCMGTDYGGEVNLKV